MRETVTFHVDGVEAESPAAICVVIEGKKVWIPKSQIHDDSEVYSEQSGEGGGDLVISEWIAVQKGLV